MASNFSFLQAEWPALYTEATKAEQATLTEPWSESAAWHKVTGDQLVELAEHVSGLPSDVRDDDEDAKRFDLLMLRTQLGSARSDVGFARLREQVRALADGLSELGSIPDVKNTCS